MSGNDDPPPTLEPRRYYDEYGREEWDRLEATLGGRLELEGTTTTLRRYLPDSGRILDAGGGAGRYAVWLGERGYDVTLVDLSERQCAIAREKVRERGLDGRVRVRRGDLRALPVKTDAFDAVVCTGGPLSHVVDDDERATALGELRRAGRSGAPVFVSVMGRLAVLQNLVRNPKYHGGMAEIARTGSYTREFALGQTDDPGFTECHFFRAAELEAALESAGFDVEKLVGLEGVAANVGERLDDAEMAEGDEEGVREAVRELRTDPAVVDWSNHILAVARV
ncbi:bifunctional 2-polyprenyl-6-hydroxyphenol methylase/3-demethylubiquinol 3-O-methyltransferase UbiG [Saliphagus sp. LR7]|uniref:class I SAM-dependent methyltransferase n=1 Tax=Saliphagus sp. LR7 TaxID=2282654 RepID=UPI000DF833D9|nr:class I SAM-dependent methyltransferase [Saliphagus sp. LR7]